MTERDTRLRRSIDLYVENHQNAKDQAEEIIADTGCLNHIYAVVTPSPEREAKCVELWDYYETRKRSYATHR